jgi:hypothetical protein
MKCQISDYDDDQTEYKSLEAMQTHIYNSHTGYSPRVCEVDGCEAMSKSSENHRSHLFQVHRMSQENFSAITSKIPTPTQRFYPMKEQSKLRAEREKTIAERSVDFNARHYHWQDLHTVMHPFALAERKRNETSLHMDWEHNGVGPASVSASVMPCEWSWLAPKLFEFTVRYEVCRLYVDKVSFGRKVSTRVRARCKRPMPHSIRHEASV